MKNLFMGLFFSFYFFSVNTFSSTQIENQTEIKNDIAEALTQ